MKESNLRLRLIVRRHNLPEVRVLFSISLQDEPTIANLLEQVNDTVPLESQDWGLDDYVVEIEDSHGHAFECLHFQPVGTILDRDEEVVIRPLFTVDRKKRLLSGRDQISADGKHLVDGVPFGRPRLRVPRGRPPVDIPPLKKRRITFDQGEDVDEEEDDEDYREDRGESEDEEDAPLMLTENGEDEDEPSVVRVQAMFDDADNWDGGGEQAEEEDLDEEEDEDEEEEAEIDEAELLDELQDLQRDNDMMDDEDHSLNRQPEPAQRTPAELDPDADLARLNKITALRRAFPAVDCHVYEDVLRRNALNERMAYRELSKSYEASMSLDQMADLLSSFSCPVLPSSNRLDAGAEEEAAESDAESTSSLVKRYDQHGFPSGSILDGSASRAAAEALRRAGHAVKAPVHTKFDDDGVGNAGSAAPRQAQKGGKARLSHERLNDDEIDISYSSSSDSEQDDDSEEQDIDDDEAEDSYNDSSSESDSDDASSDEGNSDDSDDGGEDSGPEVASTKPPANSDLPQGGGVSGSSAEPANDSSQTRKRKRWPTGTKDAEATSVQDASSSEEDSSDESSSSGSESDESSSDDSSDDESEKQGTSTSTVESTKLAFPKPVETVTQSQPDSATRRSPPGQGLSKTKARNARRKLALKAKKAALAKSASPSAADKAGEVPSRPAQTDESEFLKRKQALLEQLGKDDSAQTSSSQAKDAPADVQIGAVTDETEVPHIPQRLPDLEDSTDAMGSGLASQRRSKLDVGAGRRILFASLGLKTPKTKADEDKIRGDLMKGVRPLVNHRIPDGPVTEKDDAAESNLVPEQPEDEDPEAWRSKINYRAVECVQEGVELSEPPFPFVQRWDSQQQNGWRNKRGGRGKRKQRNQADFYEDDGALPSAKKQRLADADGDSSLAADANNTQDQGKELNYDDIPDSVPDKTQAEQPSQVTDMDDLPSLPKDLETLPALKLSEAKPGMVIAWKQMVVSKATNWAPQILDLTAVVVTLDEAAEELRVVLARRDRHLDGKEKTFDEEGNRVYDRFDAPDDDDEADGEDAEGYRTVQFSDMMDPRIVQQPLPSLQQATLHAIVESQDQADMVMADHDGLDDKSVDKEVSNQTGADSVPSNEQPGSDMAQVDDHLEVNVEGQHDHPAESSYGSVIPDSVPKDAAAEPALVSTDIASDGVHDVSITEDRRHDISLMIHEAGFRADVPPSVAKEARFSIEDLSSPSRQLDEEMSDAAAAASHQGSRSPPRALSSRAPSALREVAVPSDSAADKQTPEDNEYDTPKANPPREMTPTVTYPQLPQLPVPASSASSVHSGRQPDNDYSVDWGDDDLLHRSAELGEDLGTLGRSHLDTNRGEATPTKPAKSTTYESEDNPFTSSPLPSLEEIFSTAPIRATQSPVKAKLSGARKPAKLKHDVEYEEIMRRVDDSDGWEEDQDQIKGAAAAPPPPSSMTWDERRGQIKEERWSQQAAAGKTATTFSSSSKPSSSPKAVSPPSQLPKQELSSQSRKRRTAGSSQKKFSIPQGSQVVTLLTSSPEPEVEEHYAEDSIDSTYEDKSEEEGEGEGDDVMPGGSGWVKKALTAGGKGRGKRGVSLGALSGTRKGRESVGGKGGRGRRKTSVKF